MKQHVRQRRVFVDVGQHEAHHLAKRFLAEKESVGLVLADRHGLRIERQQCSGPKTQRHHQRPEPAADRRIGLR
ncbi:MAG: hypothetical protein A2V70_08935 [Planctomycetes bacterium RBG_13_63_9]|nr:MAG: hypothetical protein A2V70_08935 [Planctomycetes bacterium RBG_13_63_9]